VPTVTNPMLYLRARVGVHVLFKATSKCTT